MKTQKNLFRSVLLGAIGLVAISTSQTQAQTIYTVAGTGSAGYTGDGSAATSAKLERPNGVAFDAAGNMYIADSASNVIRKVNVSSNIISTIAGTGTAGSSGDGSAATAATLNAPIGIAFDASGNLFITEALGNVVRKINSSGVISTIAGTGTASTTGDGSAATAATLNTPVGIAIDASGNIFIAEANGNVIRKINGSGIISTVAGTGTASSTGDGSAATAATLDAPVGLAFDGSGNLYISESAGHRIRKVNGTGVISTYAGTGIAGSTGDGSLATDAKLRNPTGIAFDANGNLYVSETNGRFIRRVSNTDTITTVAGTGAAGYSGDGGNATAATFRRPFGIAVNRGNIFISDWNTRTVRMICDPEEPVVTAAIAYCKGTTASTLTANGTNLKWYADATTTTSTTTAPTPNTSAAGTFTYYVSQTSFEATCESPRALITVTVNDLPAAPTVIDTIAYCKGVTASALTASGSSLKWYTLPSGGSSSTTAPTPSTSTVGNTEYYVTQTSAVIDGACESPRSKTVIKINDLPIAPTVASSSINVCVGGTVTLSATGTDLKWYTVASGGTASTTTPTPSTASSGTTNYYVSQTSAVIDGACESPRTNIAVVVNSFPAAPTVTSTVNLCKDGPSSALTATGTNLKWYSTLTGGTATTTAPTPSTSSLSSTDYYVSQSLSVAAGGCEGTRSLITAVVNDNPVAPTVTSSIDLCIGGSTAALTATGTSIKWYTLPTGGTASTIAPTPSVASLGTTTFYATQSSTVGCESPRAPIAVNVQPLPVVSVASTAFSGNIFCEGKTINLKATAPTATVYSWKTLGTLVPGASSDNLNVGTTGITVVEVTDVYGCKATASIYAQQDTSIKPTLNPPVITFCTEGSEILTCNPGFVSYSFDWRKDGISLSPSTPTSNTKNVTVPGNYSVVVTNNFGCIDTTNLSIVKHYPAPAKPIITNADPILQIPNSYTYYQWYKNGAIIVGANGNKFTTTTNGKYYVEVSDVNGCVINSDTVTINKTNSINSIVVSKSDVKLYPNPTQNTVSISAPVIVNVRVLNMVGSMVAEVKGASVINLENQADGTYFFYISNEENQIISVEKITKMSK